MKKVKIIRSHHFQRIKLQLSLYYNKNLVANNFHRNGRAKQGRTSRQL